MEFDYVIVGGGSAGCVLAGRLSEDPEVSVCLLEAGPTDSSVLVRAPLGFAAGAPLGLNTARYESTPQAELGGRRVFQPRGKVLGGSSSINAMVYCRGVAGDYDTWAAQGNPGWDWASVLPLFKRAENSEGTGSNAWRGAGGPLNVAHLRSPMPIGEAFLRACEAQGVARNPDYNGADQDGCAPVQVTQRGGERCNAAAAYVTPHLRRPNLKVLVAAQAERIEFAGRRAGAVRARIGGRRVVVRARREVILSAGAFGSPQLLMLSGIGPGDHLHELGLPLVHELAGVGANLQDHVNTSLIWRSPRTEATLGLSVAGAAALLRGIGQWRRQRTGIITSNVAEALAFLRTREGLEAPDVQLHFVVAIVDDHTRKMHLGHGFTVHVTLLRPRSVGNVRLASLDPRAALRIDPRYLSDAEDLRTLMDGTRMAMRIVQGDALAPYRGALLYRFDPEDARDLEREVRRSTDTEYHPIGTCRMGPAADPAAVVGADLRVHGVERLRVVDASIMPSLPGGNTNAAAIMIGEKAADLIRAETA
jgi:choline dehydrogenase